MQPAFDQRLKTFRGNDNPHPNPGLGGGEGKLFLNDSQPTLCLKRFFTVAHGGVKLTVKRMADARQLLKDNPERAARLDVALVHEVGADWIVRDFDPGSSPCGDVSVATKVIDETLTILRESPARTQPATQEIVQLLIDRLKERSANFHWSPARNKLFLIDPQ